MDRTTASPLPATSVGGRPLRVVQVVRQFTPSRGGLEDVVSNLSRSLVNRGLDVRVVTLDRLFRSPEALLSKREVIDGIEVVRIPWRGSSRYPIAPQVFRHIGDADLVHVHAIDFFFDALAWARPFHRKPLIATTHGGFFHTNKHAGLKQLWFRTATRASALAYDAIVCCSQPDYQMFKSVAGARARLIENGVDIEKFDGLSSAAPVRRMATIGRFSVNKRLDRLLDAMASLKTSPPGWQLDIIGAPSDLSEADLRAGIATRGLQEDVHLHVEASNAEVSNILSKSSLFVSASEYEGFGLVAVEAMSAGLVPVLHSNDAYRALSLRHAGITITDFAQPATAAEAIEATYQALAATPALRSRMMAAASEHGWAGVCDRHIALYREVLGPRLLEALA